MNYLLKIRFTVDIQTALNTSLMKFLQSRGHCDGIECHPLTSKKLS